MQTERLDLGASLDDFLALPKRLYADDPRWIPPDEARQRALLSDANPFLKYGSMQAFLVRGGDGAPVARCVAAINPRIAAPEQPVGTIGFFESVDDPDAASAALSAASEWLREGGAKAIWGPMDFSMWHRYRFMTSGFEQVPYLGEPYNKPYYPAQFEVFGFERAARWRSWDLPKPALDGMLAATASIPRDEIDALGFTFQWITKETFAELLPVVHQLHVDGYEGAHGYSPIEVEEFAFLYGAAIDAIQPGVAPGLVHDAEGTPAAYGYFFPDLGPQVRAAAGLPEPAADLGGITNPYRKPRFVMHNMIVAKPYRKQGLVKLVLGMNMAPDALAIYDQAVGAVAKEGPTFYDMVGKHTREYWLYALA